MRCPGGEGRLVTEFVSQIFKGSGLSLKCFFYRLLRIGILLQIYQEVVAGLSGLDELRKCIVPFWLNVGQECFSFHRSKYPGYFSSMIFERGLQSLSPPLYLHIKNTELIILLSVFRPLQKSKHLRCFIAQLRSYCSDWEQRRRPGFWPSAVVREWYIEVLGEHERLHSLQVARGQ